MKKHYSVAIDGPAGAGKSTLARAAAERFGLIYVDTGAIYRTVGLAAFMAGVDPKSADSVAAMLPGLSIKIAYDAAGAQRMYLNGEDVSENIRMPEISMYASSVSAIPAVRSFLLEMQRDFAQSHSVVMDGRDIGTVVLPDADIKVFLTANPEKRAERRQSELSSRGVMTTRAEVLTDILRRDGQDSTRSVAPLKKADDAIVLDTSELTLPESVEALCNLIKTRTS